MSFVRRVVPIALFAVAGCLPPPMYSGLEGNYRTVGLDADLRAAASRLARAAHGTHYAVRWVGSTAEAYGIERGPLGNPVRKVAMVTVIIEKTDTHECYGQDERDLIRENEGGDTYGKPFLDFEMPTDDSPYGMFGFKCESLPGLKGGIHLNGDGATEAADQTVAPVLPAATDASASSAPTPSSSATANPEDELVNIDSGVPDTCQAYARHVCQRKPPQLVDRAAVCRVAVKAANDTAKKPGASKLCSAMWRNEKDQK
jgi:hypothetical protein